MTLMIEWYGKSAPEARRHMQKKQPPGPDCRGARAGLCAGEVVEAEEEKWLVGE